MNRFGPALVVVLAVASLGGGCGAVTPAAAPAPAGGLPIASAPLAGVGHGEQGGGGRRGRDGAPQAGLPADFPTAVPLPPGVLVGATGSAGRWSVLLLADGTADQVLRSTVAFYVGAGFSAESGAVVRRAPYRITVVTENRDHSDARTNLTIAVGLDR